MGETPDDIQYNTYFILQMSHYCRKTCLLQTFPELKEVTFPTYQLAEMTQGDTLGYI